MPAGPGSSHAPKNSFPARVQPLDGGGVGRGLLHSQSCRLRAPTPDAAVWDVVGREGRAKDLLSDLRVPGACHPCLHAGKIFQIIILKDIKTYEKSDC